GRRSRADRRLSAAAFGRRRPLPAWPWPWRTLRVVAAPSPELLRTSARTARRDRREDRCRQADASRAAPDLANHAQRGFFTHQRLGAIERYPGEIVRLSAGDRDGERSRRASQIAHVEVTMRGLAAAGGNGMNIDIED